MESIGVGYKITHQEHVREVGVHFILFKSKAIIDCALITIGMIGVLSLQYVHIERHWKNP